MKMAVGVVGAALCGRPSLPRRGAPTDLPIARGAGIFIGDTKARRFTRARTWWILCSSCLFGEDRMRPTPEGRRKILVRLRSIFGLIWMSSVATQFFAVSHGRA